MFFGPSLLGQCQLSATVTEIKQNKNKNHSKCFDHYKQNINVFATIPDSGLKPVLFVYKAKYPTKAHYTLNVFLHGFSGFQVLG